MKVGEANVARGAVDGVGLVEDGELVARGETTALGLGAGNCVSVVSI